MQLDLEDIILKRWQNLNLAHFYIIETGHFPQAETLLNEKIHTIFERIIKEELDAKGLGTPKNLWDHPDFLLISPDEEKKEYTLEDFLEFGFFEFIELRHYQLKWRFICIEDASRLSKNLCNKLLKTLEEPPKNTTLFFLNPYSRPFMETIQSRAITLRFRPNLPPPQEYLSDKMEALFEKIRPSPKKNEETELIHLFEIYLKEYKGLGQLVEKVKSLDRPDQKKIYEQFLDLERSYLGNFEHKQKVLQALNWFQTSQAFNNPSAERFFILLSSLQNY